MTRLLAATLAIAALGLAACKPVSPVPPQVTSITVTR